MQTGSFLPYASRYDTMGTIERINMLSAYFRSVGEKVIFIQHDGSKENVFLPGSEDWQLLPELTKSPDDIIISKTANDSFYNTNLQSILAQHNITDLLFTGCATDFCVDSTIKSALHKGFKITVAADGHTTADRPFLNAETVIQHYNWLWAESTPTAFKIEVKTTKEILDRT